LVEALAGLRREELAFVRLHGELLARIRASVSEERWKWVQDLLSLSNDPTPQPDDGDPTGRPDAIADPGAAREWHALAVESREEYWVALLEHELAPRSRLGSAVAGVMGPKAVQKEAGWDATEVMSIVQRLWTAAASRRDQPKQEESLPPAARHKRNRHLSPEHFMRRVYERLSEHAKTVLEADKLAPAKEALLEGRPIPAEARLEDAKYDGWKRTARIVGGTRKSDEILLAAEESSGIELLEEWTNVGELRSLRWQAATGAMADGSPPADEHVANANREAANAKLKRFVLQLSPRIHVILDQQKKADEEDLQAKLLRRLALALQRDGLFVAAIDAEQGPLNAEQTRAVILGMASLVAAKATRHGDQLRAVSTKGAQRDIDVANVRRSLGDFLADPSNPDKLAALEEGAEGLDEVTDAFTELKGKVQRYAAAVGVILVSAAMSAASAGALTPALTAATGSAIAALFINSLVATAPAIMVREGLNAGMGGARYNKGAALMRGARDLSMATVTSLAGLVGELGGAASALEGFIGNATAQPLADKLLLISPVEVAMRKVMGLTFDALERGELALDELSIQAFVKDALKDALSKGVTDVGSGAGEGVAGIAQAVAVQTTTGQVDTVGEYDTNPQALAEARVGKLLRWLHPESQQAEPASHHLPNADVTKTPVDELEERGFTLPELRAKLGLPAVLTFCVSLYRETKPLPDGWNFHEAGILATDVLAALDPGDESVLSSFLGWLGYPPEVGAMAAQASKPKTSIGGTGQTP
jgi:hypothetical protein